MALTLFMMFIAVALLCYTAFPLIYDTTMVINERRTVQYATRMERVLSRQESRKWIKFFILAPLAFAGAMLVIAPPEMRLMAVVVGFVVGLMAPSTVIKFIVHKNRDKFIAQLIDALMIMSSSFRGGLSLVQAMEAVVEEMPDPIAMEFGTVLAENKMGVSLEDALNHLYNRQPSPALQQMITAILLARETGGNLPLIFTRIVNTIREHRKIQMNLDTLTLQGKIQGVVMSGLPIAFMMVVYTSNPRYMQAMLASEMGRAMLMLAAFLWVIGVFMIIKISTFKDY